MSSWLARFDELYAISDLHLGGSQSNGIDFQIFNRGPRLAALIDHIAAQRPSGQVALVLNGDVIDSLAEDELNGYVALDEASALKMMARICSDASFAMVWQALARYLQQPGRHLVIIVGNHDLELALPVVQADLRMRLAGSDAGAQARLSFSTQGGGLACLVGAARVYCSHGNEVDAMNVVDYNQLGQLANATCAGRRVDASKWQPNGGTRVVKDVMNIVKRNYPFVDLLKPENAAIAGILMAIDRDTFSKLDLGDAFPILKDALRGKVVTSHLLGAEGGAPPQPAPQQIADALVQQLAGPSLRAALSSAPSEDDLLLAAGASAASGTPASATLHSDGTPQTLGWGDYFAGLLNIISKPEALRRALQDWFGDDRTFDVSSPANDGNVYAPMQERIGPEVDFTITGHTHLARVLPLAHGTYYNCGTWIRLLRLTPQLLADDNKDFFDKTFWPALRARSMASLDTLQIPGPDGKMVPLLFDRTNVVRISLQADGRSAGELLRVTGDDAATLKLEAEQDGSGKTLAPVIV